MTRPLRVLIPSGAYHVSARGNARAPIFLTDHDRRDFLGRLARTIERRSWLCMAYCLMPNHFHLLVRTPRPNLSAGMQALNSSYAQAFNRRHDRVGHVFQGRFHAAVVERDSHLLSVLRYVAMNPVTAGLCGAPGEWVWSSHNAVIARRHDSPVVAVDTVLELFGGKISTYRAFVEAIAAPAELADEPVHGTPEYVRAVLPDRRPSAEIPRRYWAAGRPDLADLLAVPNDLAIATAHRTYDYPLTTIAGHLRCHVSTVSRRLRDVEGRAG